MSIDHYRTEWWKDPRKLITEPVENWEEALDKLVNQVTSKPETFKGHTRFCTENAIRFLEKDILENFDKIIAAYDAKYGSAFFPWKFLEVRAWLIKLRNALRTLLAQQIIEESRKPLRASEDYEPVQQKRRLEF